MRKPSVIAFTALTCFTVNYAKASPQAQTLLLSQVVDQRKFALELEPKEILTQTLEQAKKFTAFAKASPQQKRTSPYLKECKTNSNHNPFCLFIPDLLQFQNTQNSQKKNKTHHKRPPMQQILHWIQEAQIQRLSELSESGLKDGLKQITTFSQITSLVNRINHNFTCDYAVMSSILASKAEEFLPDEKPKQTAIRLYQNVTQCNIGETIHLKARFRLSLLQIWNDDCKSALPHLQFLSQHTNSINDYRSRALYWESQCHNTLQNPKESEQAKNTLLERFPFSFHTLLVQGENLEHKIPESVPLESAITSRINSSSPVNQKLSAIEALILLKEINLAKKLLRTMDSDISKSEPSFQLYVAAIYYHLNDSLMQFKLITSIFKENPKLISRKSLQLYYPHKSFASQNRYLTELDEMLLLALIRQESAFNPEARSSAGALGLMQVMPQTARKFERIRTIKELLKPSLNLKIGTRYFSNLLKNFNGDTGLALAAYNAGPKKVQDWIKRYPVKDKVLFLDLIPYKETREYVACIARNYYWYTSLYPEIRQNTTMSQRNLNKVFTLSGS
jgi:soluble lytic murein transglycosylase